MNLWDALREAGVAALWVSDPANLRYLSSFSSPQDARLLIYGPGADERVFYTDERYSLEAAAEVSGPRFIARPGPVLEHAAPLVAGLRVGVEAEHLSVASLEDLRAAWPSSEVVPLRGVVEALRLIKTAPEIGLIRQAQVIADAAFAEVAPLVRPGTREVEVAAALESAMRRRGADRVAFDTTVASGPRGALPHAGASAKVMQAGELVTIDFGAQLGGYHSDCTRTLPCGEVNDPELKRVYRAVLATQRSALAAIRPGVRCADLDHLARQVLAHHGLAPFFTHSLGHGVGLKIHEAPGLRNVSDEVLAPGMVITIEPGVYLPEIGGVRIENLVLVTADGGEVLSRAATWDGV